MLGLSLLMACAPRWTPPEVVLREPAPTIPSRQAAAVARLALERGDETQAVAATRRLDGLDPGDPWTALTRASLWWDLGKPEAAARAWCEAADRGASAEALRAWTRDRPQAPARCAAWSTVHADVTDANMSIVATPDPSAGPPGR